MRTSADLLQDARQLRAAGRASEAEALCRKISAREPYNVDALILLAHLAHEGNDWPSALDLFRKVAVLAPANAAAQLGIAAACHALNYLEEAAQACQRVIQIRPDYANAWMNLGTLLSQMGMQIEAVEVFRRAVALDPGNPFTHSNLLYALYFLQQISAEEILAEHQRWNDRHAKPLANVLPAPSNDRSPDRPLRIGYVSSDFREHSVSFFFEPLLESHHRPDFHITCYSASDHADAVTAKLQSLADDWRTIVRLDDDQAAALIRADKIDILVDLSGHTGQHRLLLFARKPAPVQISYLGYPGSTGLTAIDYRITDHRADPLGGEGEKLLRLPTTAWCYRPPESSPEILPRPDVPLTFASFNRIAKITPDMIALWSRILAALPEARLLLKSEGLHEPGARNRVLSLFSQHDIAADRIQIQGRLPTICDHLNLYNQVDIALDTFPYHGTTTTCEALYMGTPVITLAGQTHTSRVGVSLLTSVGLPDLVAETPDEYVNLAIALANNPSRLDQMRQTLRAQMEKSPLMNPQTFVTEMESAYRSAWRSWCEGL
jgi:protein O-GlcNAc transferase